MVVPLSKTDPIVLIASLSVRWLLALVLIIAATAKLGRSDDLSETIARYRLLPRSVVPAAARALPSGELLLGVFLAAGVLVMPVAIVCAGLFGLFGVAVANSLAQGQSFDCGCGLGADTQISWSHVARAALLVSLSVLVAIEPAVLAIGASHVRGAPTTHQLIAVPLGILLLCVSCRLVGPARETVLTLKRSERHSASARGT